jgi:hypothetical protein
MRTLFSIIIVALSVACGNAPTHGTSVNYVGPDLPEWFTAPDLFDRTEDTASVAAQVWGGSVSAAYGWAITYHYNLADCSAGASAGCTNQTDKTINLTVYGASCAEASELAHEMGHIVIGDGAHTDPRWKLPIFWKEMGDALKAVTPGDVACAASIDYAMSIEPFRD